MPATLSPPETTDNRPEPPGAAAGWDLHQRITDQYAPDYDIVSFLERRSQQPAIEELSIARLRDMWAEHFAREDAERVSQELNFYVHVPFCNQVCRFCRFFVLVKTSEERVDAFIDSTTRAMDYFAPTFSRRRFRSLYVGGGTPSILSAEQTDRLLGAISRGYVFLEGSEHTFELNPVSVTREKLDVLARHGINRVSMGIQSFEAKTLELEHREYQTREMVEQTVALIQQGGRFQLNLDLILGLQGDGPQTFLQSLRDVLDLHPTQIFVYPLYPTPRYFSSLFKNTDVRTFNRELGEQYGDVVAKVLELTGARGYTTPKALLFDGKVWAFRASDAPPAPKTWYSDESEVAPGLFGVGPAARSRIPDVLSYAQKEELEVGFDPGRACFRGNRTTRRSQAVHSVFRHIIKHGEIEEAAMHREFGAHLPGDVAAALAQLEQTGTIRRKGKSIVFPTPARDRFLAGLHFIERSELEHLLITDITVGMEPPLTIRLSRLMPDHKYMLTSGDVGMALVQIGLGPPVETPAFEEVIQLFRTVFQALAARSPGLSVSAFTEQFVRLVNHYLELIRRRGHLGSLPLTTASARR